MKKDMSEERNGEEGIKMERIERETGWKIAGECE